jgi:putative transposase
MLDISTKSDFDIEVMETDKNHIHFLISYSPKLSLTSIVRRLKQISTINIWKLYPNYLQQHFLKEHTFWSDGYFVCSIGDANPDTIRKYIEQQG